MREQSMSEQYIDEQYTGKQYIDTQSIGERCIERRHTIAGWFSRVREVRYPRSRDLLPM